VIFVSAKTVALKKRRMQIFREFRALCLTGKKSGNKLPVFLLNGMPSTSIFHSNSGLMDARFCTTVHTNPLFQQQEPQQELYLKEQTIPEITGSFAAAATTTAAVAAEPNTQESQNKIVEEQTKDNSHSSRGSIRTDEEKDAKVLFDQVIKELSTENNGEPLKFPKEIIFLLGAPGSGKGTMTAYIQKTRGLTARPIVVSDLLQGSEYTEIKAKGGLVSDGAVLRELFRVLLKEENETGVIVDGFPRTEVQARALIFLWDWMEEQRVKHGREFIRPKFRTVVLYIPEELSVERQLSRGKRAIEHNERVNLTGMGSYIEVRPSDLSEEVARARYLYFKEHIWKSVQLLRSKFNYNFIDASGTKSQVIENVQMEMKYQSSLELSKEAFDMITTFPTAERLTRHARQSLIKRLDTYALKNAELFKSVLEILNNEFLHIMERQSLTGAAIIRTQNPILNQKLAVDMLLDVLLERGYNVVLDQERIFRPISINGKNIEGKEVKVWRFSITFDVPHIRG
jgi:adenylate kinase